MILLEGNIGAGKSTVGSMLKTSGMFDFVGYSMPTQHSRFHTWHIYPPAYIHYTRMVFPECQTRV